MTLMDARDGEERRVSKKEESGRAGENTKGEEEKREEKYIYT